MGIRLENARIVTEREVIDGALEIEDGVIVAVRRGAVPTGAGPDCGGELLLPGLVDIHTDNIERHFLPRPKVPWNGVAAAVAHDIQMIGAGVTTVYDSLSLAGGRTALDRQAILGPMMEGLRRAQAQGLLRATHFVHLRCEISNPFLMDLIGPYLDDDFVGLFSVMDHTPGQRQFRNLDTWREIQVGWGVAADQLDLLLEQRQADQRAHAPAQHRRVAGIARARGLPLASHDDETADHVTEAVSMGVGICEFPVTLEAARAARAAGLSVVMGAPNLVRGSSHSGNLAAAELIAADLMDIFASDYVPSSMLNAAFRLTRPPFGWDLPRAAALVTCNPARAVGLADRGVIAPGQRADLIRVNTTGDVPVARAVWRAGERVL